MSSISIDLKVGGKGLTTTVLVTEVDGNASEQVMPCGEATAWVSRGRKLSDVRVAPEGRRGSSAAPFVVSCLTTAIHSFIVSFRIFTS